MRENSMRIRGLLDAFGAWAMPRFSPSTVSQYAGVIQSLLLAGVDIADVEAAQRHVREHYAVTSWGVRCAAVKAFHRFLVAEEQTPVQADGSASEEAVPVPEEFQAWLQRQGLKVATAYRYGLCVAHLHRRLQLGESIEDALTYYQRAKPYPAAWARYVQWLHETGETVPDTWLTPGEHHFPTRVLVAIRTLTSPPWNWPLERLVTMTWGERIALDSGITWPFEPGGSPNKHLHVATKGSAAFTALVTIGTWARGPGEIEPSSPVLPFEPGGRGPVALSTLRAAIDELGALVAIEGSQGGPARAVEGARVVGGLAGPGVPGSHSGAGLAPSAGSIPSAAISPARLTRPLVTLPKPPPMPTPTILPSDPEGVEGVEVVADGPTRPGPPPPPPPHVLKG